MADLRAVDNSALILFVFDAHQIRVNTEDHENTLWQLSDLCAAFGLSNPSEVIRRLESDEYNTLRVSEGIAGNPEKIFVNEKGLYRLIFRSNKPEAKRFQNWVLGEVLPQIRKTGTYTALPALPTVQDTLTDLRHCQAALESLGVFDDGDRIRLGAHVRRLADVTMTRALGQGRQTALQALPAPQVWTLSMRLQELGYAPLLGKDADSLGVTIGGKAGRAYRAAYTEEPQRIWDYVKGQMRKVNAYTIDRVHILDEAICAVLGTPPTDRRIT